MWINLYKVCSISFANIFLKTLLYISALKFFIKAHCIHLGCLLSTDFIHQTFYFHVICFSCFLVGMFSSVAQHGNVFKAHQSWVKEDTWIPRHKNVCPKLSIYKADTFEMIQNALEDNKTDTAIVYKWTKREKV